MNQDQKAIDTLTQRFLALFTNKNGRKPELDRIYDLFIAEGVIIKNVGGQSQIYSLQSFIEPRRKILVDGTLTEFEEWEVKAKTDIAGCIAQRISLYQKRGLLNGVPFETRGIKMIQFVQQSGTWRMSAVTWDDDRPGFELSDGLKVQQ